MITWVQYLAFTKKHNGFEQIDEALIIAEGSSTEGADYTFIDDTVGKRKVYYYMLEDIAFDGTSTKHGPVKSIPKNLRAILGK